LEVAVSAALAGVAAALAAGPSPGVLRLRRLAMSAAYPRKPAAPAVDPASPKPSRLAGTRARMGSAVLTGVVACWFVGGLAGPVLGAGLGLVAWHVLRGLESTAAVRAKEARTQSIPLVAELLSAAVAAGSPPVVATEAVADAVGGAIGGALKSAAASARLGTDPASGWRALAAADPPLRPLALALAGSMSRGTSPVSVLNRVAQDARLTAHWAAEAKARSLGARAAAPLGLCFLPAFVLVGIVPVIAAAGPLLP
jgi:Flp pilus assembly protein TadB